MSSQPKRPYSTPFKQHLSFYDRDGDGLIYFGDSLRANLSLGLDFPVALVGAIGIQSIYGNTRPFLSGPFNVIEIDRVSSERNMLEDVDLLSIPSDGIERKALVASSGANTLLDRMHVMGLWALAADKQGRLSSNDIRKFQKGTMLFELEKRRKDRSDVLPLRRGGPISVAGHSWFVEKLFGVKVYQAGPYFDKHN